MKPTIAVVVAAIGLICLSGCNRNCDDGDDCALQCKPVDHSAANVKQGCCECVPAPAPMAEAPSKESANAEVKPTAPVLKAIERPRQVVEYRRPEPAPVPRPRIVRTGEIEPNDL